MACFLVHGLVVSTWVSRIASVKSALHLGDGALGLALLGTAIGSVTAIPLSGALVVRRGSRQIARWTAAGFCLSLLGIPLAHDTATLFATLLFYGAMAGANDVAINAQAVATERFLGTPTISRFHAMFSIGGIAGASAGALLAGSGVPPAAHLVSAAAGAGFSSIVPLVFAAGGRIPGVSEGAGVATVSGFGYLGFLVGPPAIGFLSELTSLRVGLFLLVLLSAGAAALVSLVVRTTGGGSNPFADGAK